MRSPSRGLVARHLLVHVDQVLVRLGEGVGVDLVHGIGAELFDELEAVDDQREIVARDMLRVGEAVFVEVFDQVLTIVRGDVGVIDRFVPERFGERIGADVAEGFARQRNGDGDVGVGRRVLFAGFARARLLTALLLRLRARGSMFLPCLTSLRLASTTRPMPLAYSLNSFSSGSIGVVSWVLRQFSNSPSGVEIFSVVLITSARSIATLGASSW
jgi:hypothetical protein